MVMAAVVSWLLIMAALGTLRHRRGQRAPAFAVVSNVERRTPRAATRQ